MVHFRYVRTVVDTGLVTTRGTLSSRVMPARLTLTGMLLFWSAFAIAQPFLRPACDAACQPLFTEIQPDVVLDCDAAFPAFVLPEASGCATSPISQTPSVELDYTSSTRYTAETAEGLGPDWALWLAGFEDMGLGASEYFHPAGEGMAFEVFANGTARFTGEIANDTDADQRFMVDVFLQYAQDDDSGLPGPPGQRRARHGRFPDWTYYEWSTPSAASKALAPMRVTCSTHYTPFSRLDSAGRNGANNRNTNYGISGWFWYRGVMSGADVVGTGDINVDLNDAQDLAVACPVVEGRERISMAWSDCGHDVQSHTVERHDMEAPVFVELPPLESADCTSLPDTADIADFVVSDDCGSALSLEVLSDVVDGEPCNQVLTRPGV